MKEVLFRSRIDLVKRKKTFSIRSNSEDKQCKTQVDKTFTYMVDRARTKNPQPRKPLVFIKKSFDTLKGVEGFSFHVKGYFYITCGDEVMKVLFHHTLDICITWKANHFSPKKSESLT